MSSKKVMIVGIILVQGMSPYGYSKRDHSPRYPQGESGYETLNKLWMMPGIVKQLDKKSQSKPKKR